MSTISAATAVVVRALIESGHIDGSCLTITGRVIAEEYGGANAPDCGHHHLCRRGDQSGRWPSRF